MRFKRAVEFNVTLPVRPGALADLMSQLASRKVNLKAFMLHRTVVVNIPNAPQASDACHMLVNDDDQARSVFKDLKIRFQEEEVLLLRSPDLPGALAETLTKLGEAGIRVKAGYASVPSGHEDRLVVLSCFDNEKAIAILSDLPDYVVLAPDSR